MDVEVQSLGDFEEPELDEDEDDESDLLPEELSVFMGPGAPEQDLDPEEARALLGWFPVLNHLASQPGSSTGMRQLAAAIRARLADD